MTTAVIAEKPSVARDLARVLEASERGDGLFRGNGFVVTWAIGHLVRLPEPGQIEAAWGRWRREDLPILPRRWPLQVEESTRAQFSVVSSVLADRDVDDVVCATDAGREGELIFRYLYEKCGCHKPVRRLWISSLTPEAIREGFSRLRPGAELDPLADAARGRSRADWLVGMNFSRAVSLAHDDTFSVGRVQTPTLAMLVDRDREIEAFVPSGFLELVATFDAGPPSSRSPTGAQASGMRYRGVLLAGGRGSEPRRFPLGKLGSDGTPDDVDGAELARAAAAAVARRVESGHAVVEDVRRERRSQAPPLLYDLTELQRHANRLYGFSAKRTLDTAQSLYERWKLLTYPRTDSRHLSTSVAAGLREVVDAVRAPYEEALAPQTGQAPPGRRFVDDRKVSDHHAILPTPRSAELERLAADERRIYDLVCRRFLMMWQGDWEGAATTVITAVSEVEVAAEAAEPADRFRTRGLTTTRAGWKALEPTRSERTGGGRPTRGSRSATPASTERTDEDPEAHGDAQNAGRDATSEPEQEALPALDSGQRVEVVEARVEERRTKPPQAFNEATLLTAMETAGRTLEDRELSEAMKERGLGTPATRAEIIETLIRRSYVARQGRKLGATERGRRLIDLVHPSVKSPALTGEWEAKLRQIERAGGSLDSYLREIERYVSEVVAATLDARGTAEPGPGVEQASEPEPPTSPPGAPASRQPGHSHDRRETGTEGVGAHQATLWQRGEPGQRRDSDDPLSRQAAPDRPREPRALLRSAFGFDSFRPFQEQVCRALIAGQDALLVMPTGAGKSLCYQLPGLARGGTTVVVSPLIALMEDQVQKLRDLGLRADRIHSGRPRDASRAASRDYLEGRLDFLYLAPERLRVPGFPELLSRRPPVLVAIDEAHCISHWGHDFRPDYRLLGERLPALRPAPVIALTATATPRVQADILAQLGLRAPSRFIHGFRRTNLAIEVVELKPSARAAAVASLLADPGRRPAIVYASTRKEAESLAQVLGGQSAAAPYHAGLSARRREEAQTAFLSGDLQIVVATIAFGMGVDKADVRTVVHTGLPGSLEGYYQEIGRAGRDGAPARAVLFYSWADRRTHEFFHQRDYPEPEELAAIYKALGATPESAETLRRRARLDAEIFESALDKLWTHGGAVVDADQLVSRGRAGWREPYVAQRAFKLEQLAEMARFADGHSCRMLHVVHHFGDQDDTGQPCGLCDVCAPEAVVARRWRQPSADERQALELVLDALRRRDGASAGQLHRAVSEVRGDVDRGELEDLLGGLARAGLVKVEQDAFTKDGREIRFQRVRLAPKGRRATPGDLAGIDLVASVELAAPGGKRAKSKRRAAGAGAKKERRRGVRGRASVDASPTPAPLGVRAQRPLLASAPLSTLSTLSWRRCESGGFGKRDGVACRRSASSPIAHCSPSPPHGRATRTSCSR